MRRTLLHVAAMMGLLLTFTCTSSAYYDPTSGRFLSPDPLGHEASMDLYSYASGDPINFCDPDGRCGQNSMQAMSDPRVQAYVEGLKQSDYGQTHSGGVIQPGQIQEDLEHEWALIRQAIWDRSVDSSEIDNPLRFDPIGRFAAGVIRDVVDATGIGALATFYHDSYYRQEWLTGRPVTQDEATFRVLMSAATMPMMIIAPEARLETGLLEGAGARMVGGEASFAAESVAPAFRTWNQFQAGTAGWFASRAEAAQAWTVYKEANGIVTGTARNMAARSEFLSSLADNPNTASWMKPWLQDGRVPPGYEVNHIKPLSIGGPDTPANMRLILGADHDLWHSIYHPWTKP